MDPDTQRSKELVVQYWGPVEELLLERFPNARTTAERIREQGKILGSEGLIRKLEWLNRQRNRVSHTPYAPIEDMGRFRRDATEAIQVLRRNSSRPINDAPGQQRGVPPEIRYVTVERVVTRYMNIDDATLPSCPKPGCGGRLRWNGRDKNICYACGFHY